MRALRTAGARPTPASTTSRRRRRRGAGCWRCTAKRWPDCHRTSVSMDSFHLREFSPADKTEVADLIYASINVWYMAHGMGQPFKGGPQTTEVFHDVYSGIGTSRCVVAENRRSGRLMGSCYYHPRKTHVGLGI